MNKLLILLVALLASACSSNNNDNLFWVLLLICAVALLVWQHYYSQIPDEESDEEAVCSCCDDKTDELTACAGKCGNEYCNSCAPHLLNNAGLCGACGEEEILACDKCRGETIASRLVDGLCAKCRRWALR